MDASKFSNADYAARFKTRLVAHLANLFIEKVNALESEINQIQDSANQEQKSSAGDKHETARAMAQLEVEMHSKRLAELKKQAELVRRLDFTVQENAINAGNLVFLDEKVLFLASGIGPIEFENITINTIGLNSPVAHALLHKRIGESILIQNKEHKIVRFL